MKKTIKIVSLVLTLVLTVSLLTACSSKEKADKPEDAVKKTVETFFADLKSGNIEGTRNATLNSENTNFLQGVVSEATKEPASDLSKKMFKDLSYEIKSVKLDGDNKAVATVDVTSIDYGLVMATVAGKVLQKGLANLNMTDTEIEQLTIDSLKEALSEKNLAQKTTKDVKINLEKKDGDWKIKSDSELQKAILGGFTGNNTSN